MRIAGASEHRLPLAAMLAASLALAACSGGGEADQPASPGPASQKAGEAGKPALPIALQPVDRKAMLALASVAADAAASGAAPPASSKAMVGRDFELRLPFGCAGQDGAGDVAKWAGWSLDSRNRVLRLRARPERWGKTPLAKALLPEGGYEVVEGFWIERPWTLSEACPPRPASPDETAGAPGAAEQPTPLETAETPAAEAQSIGLAHFLSAQAPRRLHLGRRPFAVSRKIEAGAEAGSQGFRLLLKGRLSSFPDGQPVRCEARAAEARPVCLVAVDFSAIAFEDPASGETMASWSY